MVKSCRISELPEAGRDYAFQDGGGVRGNMKLGRRNRLL